jgi:hypothetical protein
LQTTLELPRNKTSFASLLCGVSICAVLSIPTKTANFDFRHFTQEEGLTISFSKSAPPLAALEDERLPIVPTEPAQEIVAERGVIPLLAGEKPAWPKLKRYARFFARQQWLKDRVIKKYVRHIPRKPFSGEKVAFRALNAVDHKEFKKLTKISDLTKLMVAVPVTELREQKLDLKKIQVAQAQIPQARPVAFESAQVVVSDASPHTMRDEIEAPLTAPAVQRSLPKGEEPKFEVVTPDPGPEKEAAQKTQEPEITAAPIEQLIVDNKPKDVWKIAAVEKPRAQGAPVTQRADSPPQNPSLPDRGTHKNPDTSFLTDDHVNDPLFAKSHIQDPPQDKSVSTHKISGRVELMGGLAVAGNSTRLDIQWKTGNQTRAALIDYSTGEFVVETPTLLAGKLIATLVDETNRILGQGDFDLTDVAEPEQSVLEGVKILIEPRNSIVKGQIFSAYSVGNIFIPVKEAELFAPASVRERADDKGNFRLGGLSSDSTFFLDGYAPEHWGTRVLAEGSQKPRVPVFSEKMLQSFFDLIGQSANNTELGVVWGEVKRKGKSVSGVKVGISTPDAIGPIYFNALRIPDKNLTETSDNGLYAFVKVRPGLHVVMSQIKNHELPSTVVSVQPTMVSYSEINLKTVQLRGRIYDPVNQRAVKAQVSIVGSSKSTVSGNGGFTLKAPSTDPVLFVEANAGPEYFVSREAIAHAQRKNVEMYVFKKSWFAEQFRKADIRYDEHKGILLGYVNGPAFHVTLDSEDREYSDQSTLYFDGQGKIEPGRIEGVAGGGGFIMTNLKPGLHTLVITSAEGEMVASRIFVSEAGVLNVLSMPLRP